MISATSLPLHSNPAVTIPATGCIQPPAWACIGVLGLEPDCAGSAQCSKVPALADGRGAGLELVEDFQGSLVSGGHNSSRHSTIRRTEMFAGFCHAILFQ